MRDMHLRNHCVSVRDDPEHFDRPAFRIFRVELDEFGPAPQADQVLGPLEDEVLREQLAHTGPVARLDAAPELCDNLRRVHATSIRRRELRGNSGRLTAHPTRPGPLERTEPYFVE